MRNRSCCYFEDLYQISQQIISLFFRQKNLVYSPIHRKLFKTFPNCAKYKQAGPTEEARWLRWQGKDVWLKGPGFKPSAEPRKYKNIFSCFWNLWGPPLNIAANLNLSLLFIWNFTIPYASMLFNYNLSKGGSTVKKIIYFYAIHCIQGSIS